MINAILIMLAIGAVLGLILGIADKVFEVKVDERITTVTGLLPGYNCGGCGYAGCAGLADALVTGEVNTVALCKPSKPEQREKINDYLSSTPGPDGKTIQLKA